MPLPVVRFDNIFETEADLLVVPCSAAGTVSRGIADGLRRYNLPVPQAPLVPGEVRLIPVAGRERRWKALCFAASVASNRPTMAIVQMIWTRVSEMVEGLPYLNSVVTPLLGSGAGGLDARSATRAMMRGLESAMVQETRFTICVLNTDAYASVKEALNEWSEGSQEDEENPVDEPSRGRPVARVEAERSLGLLQSSHRKALFISYAHKDRSWLERLQVHLKPLEDDYTLEIWDDTKIRPGSKWREEIASAIETAKVAILLISADFLASAFIKENELPPLLKAAELEGAVILPVIVSASRFLKTASLSCFQAVNDPALPLDRMKGPRREHELARVVDAVEGALTKG